ncbi:MAG TPA: hypothetical protein VKV17_16620 [Bryobacteraceae bacterium]|nr:hypothetical protein [Bryobacteraceae bacterium]
MRLVPLITLVTFVRAGLWGADSPQLAAAREKVKKLEILVEAGAAAPAQLAQAREEVADAEDDAVVSAGFRNGDLTEEQADAMAAAANRRLERREQAYQKTKKLVDDGLAIPATLPTLAADLDFVRKEHDLVMEVAGLAHQRAAMAQAEAQYSQAPLGASPVPASEHYDGDGYFGPQTLAQLESDWQARFGRPLPISANGETAVHRALGFDHTGRVDVAVTPDQPEGVWLRSYLEARHIPYFAFRQAVPGKATGAHIHVGPQSTRLAEAAGSRPHEPGHPHERAALSSRSGAAE